MTRSPPATEEGVEVHAPRPWAALFDEVLAPMAQQEYGFLPFHWSDARQAFVAVDEGLAQLMLCGDVVFLRRGASLQEASAVLMLLKRLVDAGVELTTEAAP